MSPSPKKPRKNIKRSPSQKHVSKLPWTTKKSSKKAVKKKIRCLRVKDPERLYKIINSVQIKRKRVNVHILDPDMMLVVENIFADAEIKYEKKKDKTCDVNREYYVLSPGPENVQTKLVLDQIEDEDKNKNFDKDDDLFGFLFSD